MDLNYIRKTLGEVTQRMQDKSATELITTIASKTKNMKAIERDDQLLLGAILGSKLHQGYCDSRKLEEPLENGLQNNPRIKELKDSLDKDFVLSVLEGRTPQSSTLYVESGKVFMDIANRDFTQLSPYWQYDNYMAGCSAVRSIITNWEGLTHNDPAVRNFVEVGVANSIHESWISRGNVYGNSENNGVIYEGNQSLETSYINLPADEQNKDLLHYTMAKSLIQDLSQEMINTQGNEQ